MPKIKKKIKKINTPKKPIVSYKHMGKDRLNNPPVGLVTPETVQDSAKQTYSYDPHLDPQLIWAGKAEHTSSKFLQFLSMYMNVLTPVQF